MHDTQVSVWEIQYPNTLCQYQDTVELQEILLLTTVDPSSAQGTRTMMLILVAAVHSNLKVAGGIIGATIQISTVSTSVDHTPPLVMV